MGQARLCGREDLRIRASHRRRSGPRDGDEQGPDPTSGLSHVFFGLLSLGVATTGLELPPIGYGTSGDETDVVWTDSVAAAPEPAPRFSSSMREARSPDT
jgi:hypothetical protein